MSSPPPVRPLALSDYQYSILLEIAQPLPVQLRSEFLERVAKKLHGVELGDGAIYKACKDVQRELFSYPLDRAVIGGSRARA
jgi:hypothetical protein